MIAESAPKEFGISDFIAHRTSSADENGDEAPKKLTCRIPSAFYRRLQRLAEACDDTATGLAEELLCFAIRDAWQASGLDYSALFEAKEEDLR